MMMNMYNIYTPTQALAASRLEPASKRHTRTKKKSMTAAKPTNMILVRSGR